MERVEIEVDFWDSWRLSEEMIEELVWEAGGGGRAIDSMGVIGSGVIGSGSVEEREVGEREVGSCATKCGTTEVKPVAATRRRARTRRIGLGRRVCIVGRGGGDWGREC